MLIDLNNPNDTELTFTYSRENQNPKNSDYGRQFSENVLRFLILILSIKG